MTGEQRSLIAVAVATALLTAGFGHGAAQTKSRIPDRAVYQAMLNGARDSGWVAFRNWNGQQLVYFTALQTLHCRLSEIRYSINSDLLDKRFELVKCNPQNPLALPSGSGLEDIAIQLPPETARTVAVQVVWDDGGQSEVMVYEPCKDVGDQTCAWPVD
ncbi:hypothetical protein [Salaquimonas pukyongi]|uniref:hypothetical protein n=1 Tax=Salaquimonas pukyongi TaxID=2712698 RepID=UPI00096B7E04|nr:hypothetical protein [Salaquimonas pukyongi]